MESTPQLDELIPLALAAGRDIMRVRDAGVEALAKEDGSPVTEADKRAEAIIRDGLLAIAPDIPMQGEESAEASQGAKNAPRYFCVDPLDGTRDFVESERGEFTVNIALIEDRTPVLGVIYAPATGELFAGGDGRLCKAIVDARTQETLEPLHDIATTEPGEPWRVFASRRSGGAKTNAFVESLGEAELVSASSSMKFCRIAEGRADLYPRFGDVCDWDAAAGHAIVIAAGGGMMLLDGTQHVYGMRADNIIPGFVAYSGEVAEAAARKALGAVV